MMFDLVAGLARVRYKIQNLAFVRISWPSYLKGFRGSMLVLKLNLFKSIENLCLGPNEIIFSRSKSILNFFFHF